MRKKQLFFFVYAFAIALATFSGLFNIGTLAYVILTFAFFVICFLSSSGGKSLHIGPYNVIGFIAICVVSIFINHPPSYFRVWERLAIFVSTLLAFSPLFVGKIVNRNRIMLFDNLVKVMMIFAVLSFFAYFLGINFFIRNGELLDYTEAGHFSGFTNHSMVLAPIAAISAIYGLTKILSSRIQNRKVIIWWAVTLCCYGSVLLSASRGSLGGVAFASIVAVYRYNSGRMGRFLQYALLAVATLSLTFPLWGGLTDAVSQKNEYNISQGGVVYSREAKMAARLYEIKNNPLTGVGFSVVDESVDNVDRETGTVEPNSSWLGVFSMTGVFGFILFAGIFIRAFITAYRKITDKSIATFLCGILAFFLVHMMIEGYVLAGGNFLCGTYWLTLGVVYAYSSLYNKPALK